jgi:hypothetical protein
MNINFSFLFPVTLGSCSWGVVPSDGPMHIFFKLGGLTEVPCSSLGGISGGYWIDWVLIEHGTSTGRNKAQI